VYRLGDPSPGGDLVGAVKARRADDAVRLVGDLRALGDDQPGGRALDVIVAHHVCGHIVFGGAGARHRRHHDTVGKRQALEVKTTE
jgi:hypothetical protein